jgi:hypothetical protein
VFHVNVDHEQRRECLLDIIELRRPISEAVGALGKWPWDCEQPLVVLRKGHLEAILVKFDSDLITGEDVTAWAEALEVPDDIEFDPRHAELIRQTIVDLTWAPLMPYGDLSPKYALELLERLRAATDETA